MTFYLDGIVRTKEVESELEANELLQQGWVLLQITERFSFKQVADKPMTVSHGIWKLGSRFPTRDQPKIGISKPSESPPSKVTPNYELIRAQIKAQDWGKGKYGGEWCFAIESNGKKARPEVLDLALGIENSPGEKLVFEGYEYTLSKKATAKYPPKSFIRRRKLGGEVEP